MTEFWIIAALLLLPGVLILAPSLLRPRIKVGEDLNSQNVQISRDRLAELEAEHVAGGLTDDEFEQAKAELEGNLLDDIRESGGDEGNDAPSRMTLAALLLLVPLSAVLLYLNLGSPKIMATLANAPQGESGAASSHDQQQASMDELLARLEDKLKKDPENVEGWFILGRSYMSQGRYKEAVRALEEIYNREPDNSTVLVSLADALTMSAGGAFSARSEELLQKALELDPGSATALWLLGMANQERGEYAEAIGYWQRAIPLLQSDANAVSQLGSMIDKAKSRGGLSDADIKPVSGDAGQTPAAAAEIKVSVTLDAALVEKASADDVLFVLARAIDGPPMPLAAAKHRVADLPLEVTLSDAMAMMPDRKLSSFDRVLVQARIAKGGTPMAQSGDLQSSPVETGTNATSPVELVINGLVP